MLRLSTRPLLLLSLALLLTVSACDLFGGDDDADPQGTLTTVQAVLDNPQDDQRVALSGRILEQTGTDTFVFADDTGQIRIEIDDDILARQEILPQMDVGISGEVETHAGQDPEIDVERLTVLDAGPNA